MQEDCMKEIDLLRKLDHENIVHYYTMFFEDDHMYIVLELADAGDLNVMLKVGFFGA
jgi:NIMA (never in mitosis gene a)-related kinase